MIQTTNIVLESISCCVGCSEGDEILFCARDLLHDLPGDYNVVRCRGCGLMRTNPRPTQESIGMYYPDSYGPYLGTVVDSTKAEGHKGIKRFLKPIVNRIFRSYGKVLPVLEPARMLEVGCASGSFLHHMAGQGWAVHGIEFSKSAARAANKLGYSVHAGSLESAPQPEEPFDLIVGWMVLEHLHDPIASLRRLRDWVKPDAWLVLSTPNAGSFEFRLFKGKGYALQVPTHLHHFTPQSLEKVLSVAGWRLDRIYHQRTLNNFIGSLGYMLRDVGCIKIGNKLITFPDQGGVMAYFLYPIAWLLSLFGQTGRMTVWARRVN